MATVLVPIFSSRLQYGSLHNNSPFGEQEFSSAAIFKCDHAAFCTYIFEITGLIDMCFLKLLLDVSTNLSISSRSLLGAGHAASGLKTHKGEWSCEQAASKRCSG